jgi:hypothetical protein
MDIKEEIKKDEELLIQVFKLEKFVRKYKNIIIAFFVIVILGVAGKSLYDYYKTQKLIKENLALEKLLSNPNDKEALNTLKENKALYDLYLLKKGQYSKISTPELESFKAFEEAMESGDVKLLEEYVNNPKYFVLKDMARLALIRAYLLDNKRDKAKIVAEEITDKKVKDLAVYLLHYGIVK